MTLVGEKELGGGGGYGAVNKPPLVAYCYCLNVFISKGRRCLEIQLQLSSIIIVPLIW